MSYDLHGPIIEKKLDNVWHFVLDVSPRDLYLRDATGMVQDPFRTKVLWDRLAGVHNELYGSIISPLNSASDCSKQTREVLPYVFYESQLDIHQVQKLRDIYADQEDVTSTPDGQMILRWLQAVLLWMVGVEQSGAPTRIVYNIG